MSDTSFSHPVLRRGSAPPTTDWQPKSGPYPNPIPRSQEAPARSNHYPSPISGMQAPFSKLVLITGGTRGGLGFEAARQLLSSGHRVILTLRDEAKAKAAIAALVAEQPSAAGRVQWVVMDLMCLASVRSASQELSQKHATLDVLMVGSAAVPDE